MVNLDCAACDGKPKTDSATQAAAIRFHPVEGIEDGDERFTWDARTEITDAEMYFGKMGVMIQCQADIHHTAFRRITDGIADYVLERATQ